VTLSQAVPVPCQGCASSSSQEIRIYLNAGFSSAASQQDPVTSPLSGMETAVCGFLVGCRWGKHGLVGSAAAGCRRWWGEGFRSKGASVWLCCCPLFAAAFHRGAWSVAVVMAVASPRNPKDGLCLLNTLLLEKQMFTTETLWLCSSGVPLSSESLAPQAGEIHLQSMNSHVPQTLRGILPNFLPPAPESSFPRKQSETSLRIPWKPLWQ